MLFRSKSNINNLNICNNFSNNIIRDINNILSGLNKLSKSDNYYLHDDKFKIVKKEKKSNYFNPSNDNEILLYNSIDKTTYQQSEFRKQIWKIEEEIKEKINEYAKNNNEYTVNIDFYDDSKYEMVWILCKINKRLNNS